MRRNFKNVVAFALSTVLVIGSSMSILAEEPGQAASPGVGQMEEITKPDVYQVLLPTDVNGIFDFVLDPQKLIEETNAEIYGGKSYEKGATVFFHRSDGQTADEYSSSSDPVTIINRSTVPVDVLIKVGISQESLGSIAMTDDRGFIDDASASLYMALTDGEHTVPIRAEGSYIQTTIPAAPEDAFEYSYDQESGKYSYGLKDNLSGVQFPEYSFQLTGAVNEKGDWSTVKNVALLVNVTWEVTPSRSIDPGEQKNSAQTQSLEQNLILNQSLDPDSVEKEAKEEENVWNSTSFLDKEAVPDEKISLETDMDLNSDADLKEDAEPDIDRVSDISDDLDKNMDSAENTEFGEGITPNIVKTTYTLKPGKPISVVVDLGSGGMAATEVVSVKWKETDDELLGTEDETGAVRYKEGKLLFSKEWVDECLADVSKQHAVLVVTFDDAGKTEEEIMLSY